MSKASKGRAARKTAFHEVVAKIQSGAITPDELRKFFKVNGARLNVPDEAFRVNEGAVDIAGIERSSRRAASYLVLEASETIKARRYRVGRPSPGQEMILAEGDSWANLPELCPKTFVDELQSFAYIENIAMWGDILAGMIADGDYVKYLHEYKIRRFIFSAGGNDALEGIGKYLRLYNIDYTDPSQAAYYVKPEFYQHCSDLEALYRSLADQVSAIDNETVLYVHGYDYVLPSPGGAWLGAPMRQMGLDCVHDEELCRAILRIMIDEWNCRLKDIAKDHMNFVHVDFRETLGENDWSDELHPKTAGARKLASVARRALGL